MKNMKRNIVAATILLFVCAAVYLNWSYNNKWGQADEAMVEAEDEAMAQAEADYEATLAETDESAETGAETDTDTTSASVSDYFAEARLSRQQSRDEALSLLESAASLESASQEAIDSAMADITAMANWSMQEAQIENMLLAKDFADCVVFLTEETVSVAVPAPLEGLSEASVARITDTITSETNYTADQIKIIEVKDE